MPTTETQCVEVHDSDGAVIAGTVHPYHRHRITLLAALTSRSGFWQYGTLQWDEFYRYITAFTVAPAAWTIFQYDLAQQKHGESCPSGVQIVQEGHYMQLHFALQ